MAALMETEPMGLQFGLLTGAEPSSALQDPARARPGQPGGQPVPAGHASAARHTGVAMITGADEAIAAHQRVAEASWRDAVKGTPPPPACAKRSPRTG